MIISISLLFITFIIINFCTINIKIRRIIQLLIFQSNSMIKKINLKEEKQKINNPKILKEKIAKKSNKDKVRNILSLNHNKINLKLSQFKQKNKNNKRKSLRKQISNPRKKKEKKINIFNSKKVIIINKNIIKKKYATYREKINVISKSNLLNSKEEKFLKKSNKIKMKKIYNNSIAKTEGNDKKKILNSNKDIIVNKNIIKKGYVKKNENINIISKSNLLSFNDEEFLKKSNIIKMKKINNNSIAKIEGNDNKNNNIIDKIILLIPKKERIKYFHDDELNSLEYNIALKIDFRTYGEFYLSLLKQTHLIIFTFFVLNDYNLLLLKLSLFLISFSLFIFMNTLFFNDDSIHKIYEDEGKYNILYQIPQTLYSAIFSQIISSLLEKLSLSQDNILSMKEKGDINKMKEEISRVVKCIKI